ncbi:DMT family transporter [Agitococcus lubricus]|uniref:Threonine/homoserine efflux transporter RhtA n=1 Tax=Agitococcus lubricus TaxID=1077255 RepID=A0A2T5J3X3_9GAMM|nr:DMT family transporter [Agitococcus lubricus]PTQ91315.1 threonine/homoserine efflux transporter RhtA [Agitococcus lubricus]
MLSKSLWLKLGLTSFFWAAMFYLGQYAVRFLSAESVSAWRFLLGAMVVIPLVKSTQGIDIKGIKQHFIPLLIMAIVGIGGFNLALFHGLQHTSAMNGALIMALCPVIISLFGVLFGESFSFRQMLGLLFGLAGVVIVITQGNLANLSAFAMQKGDLLVLLAAVCWALYSTIPKRFIKNLDSLQVTVATVTMSSILLSVYAQSSQGDLLRAVPFSAVAAIGLMGLFGSGLAYIWWNDAVRSVGANTVSIFMNLVPIYTALMSVMLGQNLTVVHILGTVFVLIGVSLNTAKTSKPLALNEVK